MAVITTPTRNKTAIVIVSHGGPEVPESTSLCPPQLTRSTAQNLSVKFGRGERVKIRRTKSPSSDTWSPYPENVGTLPFFTDW
jgi:hypothetical protein